METSSIKFCAVTLRGEIELAEVRRKQIGETFVNRIADVSKSTLAHRQNSAICNARNSTNSIVTLIELRGSGCNGGAQKE